jgi:hypothetical protein
MNLEKCMDYADFIDSLAQQQPAQGMQPVLQALWYDAKGDWHRAHEIVQQRTDAAAARIHAYLHRKEGDDWNARYWHRRAGTTLPKQMSLAEEWESLVRNLLSQ